MAVVAVQADVVDLVDLAAVDQVDVEDAVGLAKVALVDVEVTALGAAFPAPVIVEAAVDVMDVILDVLAVVSNAKVALDVLVAADLVLAHVLHTEKDRPVQLVTAVLAVLAHAHHAHHVADVADVADVQVDAADVLGVRPAAKVTVLPNVADVPVDAILHVRDVQVDVRDVQEAVVDVRDVVLDAMGRALVLAMDVVMAVVGNAKTHVLPTAQQRALEPAKLKHLVP